MSGGQLHELEWKVLNSSDSTPRLRLSSSLDLDMIVLWNTALSCLTAALAQATSEAVKARGSPEAHLLFRI